MAEYPYLRFFNGVENELNLKEDLVSGVLTGSVFLPEVSTGLYESANIFILEEQKDAQGNPVWGTPIGDSGATQFKVEWVEDVYSSSDLFFYGTKIEDETVKIQELNSLALDTLDHTNLVSTDVTGLKEVSDYINSAMQINVGLSSKNEGRHDKVLRISDTFDNTVLAEILVYGETVGEDERLRDLLQNLGGTLDDGDFIMFKEHDINEYGIDWKLMNQKRRELLLELHNIKPFVGTYKAVLNAIDFFGYNNITLKEYWLNINQESGAFGKLQAVPVPDTNSGFSYKKRKKFNLPNSNLKKTSRFSLVYKLNNPNGEFDIWDIPEVEEAFDFTPEEVLIKLYGLKGKLQRDYLPLQAKIVDITGEGDFFDQKNINTWNNQEPIALFNEGKDVEFKIFPENKQLYIEDYKLLTDSNILIGTSPGSIIGLEEFDDISQSDRELLLSDFENFYSKYYEEDKDSFNNSVLGYYDVPVGSPLILECTSLPQTWEDADFPWADAIDPQITWNNWWKKGVYEIEWIVTGPRGYSQSFKGDIGYWETNGLTSPDEVLTWHPEMLKLAIIVPYTGDYAVELRLTDLNGFTSFHRKDEVFNVEVKPIELYGIYQWKENKDWRKWKTSWENTGGYWDLPTENLEEVRDSFQSLYLTMDRNNYLYDESQGKQFSTVRRFIDNDPSNLTGYGETTGPYTWDAIDEVRWNDFKHSWWNSTRIGSDLAASFKISDAFQGNVLTIKHFDPITKENKIGYYTITSSTPAGTGDIAGWQAIADELNASTDEIISKFNYNPVFEDTNNDGNVDTFNFLLGVGKNYSYSYDFEEAYFSIGTGTSNGTIIGEVHFTSYNPTFDSVRIVNGCADIERSTHVTISVDKTQMPGIKNPVWKIYKDTNADYSDIYYDNMWLPYLFQKQGSYRISLELEDSNGNKNSIERNMINVK